MFQNLFRGGIFTEYSDFKFMYYLEFTKFYGGYKFLMRPLTERDFKMRTTYSRHNMVI